MSWSERLMRTDAVTFDNDAAVGMMQAIMEFNPVLQDLAVERTGCPADDLISVWAGAGMDPLTLLHEPGLYTAGGSETTRTVIGRASSRLRPSMRCFVFSTPWRIVVYSRSANSFARSPADQPFASAVAASDSSVSSSPLRLKKATLVGS